MDVVRVFNNELSSLYEVKPPISKAKMTQITKCAIKGIKFYKHIVQSVEKFIQKCRPEYKVPGLYVVDSIVRQSRHQFGADKDVFAPRFTKNIAMTFMNLFKCAEEDKAKIVRVLNLWQKNSVFPCDVIQPLLDMANPNPAGEWDIPVVEENSSRKAVSQAPVVEPPVQNSKSKTIEASPWKGWTQNIEEPAEESHNYTEMTAKNLEKFAKTNYASSAVPEPIQVPQSKPVPPKSAEIVPEENTVKFNKKLLDFDYGDEDDDDDVKMDDEQLPNAPNPLAIKLSQNFLSNPELLCQFQQMQQTIQQSEALKSELSEMNIEPQIPPPKEHKQCYSPEPPDNDSMGVNAVSYHEQQQQHTPNIMPFPPFDNAVPYTAPPQPPLPLPEPKMPMEISYQHSIMQHDELMIQSSQVDEDERLIFSMPAEPLLPPQDLDERAIVLPTIEDRIRKERSRSRSGSHSRGRLGRHRSRSRSPRRRRSRSGSRSRSRRNRSRSRERQREKEREREKERDRKRKGIPQIKKNHISVCSTTLWLGHVPKTLSEIDVSSVFTDFGRILTIDMIPPRGCAYVVMDQRQDAHRALQKLKNLKLQGSSIKMAWAPGKGVKGKEFKEYWEAESGVSYIPFDKVPSNDLQVIELLEEGGFIDEESLPQSLKDLLRKRAEHDQVPVKEKEHTMDNHQEPVMPQAPSAPTQMMPNSSVGLPMVIPQMMQPQFGMPLPGLLPPQSMVVQMPVAVPPPNQLMMVQPPAQTLLAGTPLPVGSIPQMPHMSIPHPSLPPSSVSMSNIISNLDLGKEHPMPPTSTAAAGDATPTDEDGTSVSSPGCTTVGQSLSSGVGPSVSSLSSMGVEASVGQFSAVMTHHGMSRPMLPVLPPVSSAGTPIPFPPPQVGFGFPPPPLRPNQNMTGVIPLANSFPWLHKTSAQAFGNYADSEMRYASPMNHTAVNMRPPMMNQPGVHPNTTVGNNQMGPDVQHQQPPPKDIGMKSSDKNSSVADGGKQYNNRSNSNQSHAESYGRPGGNSPKSFDKDHDAGANNQDDMHPVDFPRDMDMGMIPRYPGPPDYHAARVPLRGHWIPGPGQRFPRNMHPGMPFPPRVPRMEMEFFHHQGPRMHVPGPHGQAPMWGGNGYPPPRNPDHPPMNRREFYGDSHYQEEEREKKFHPREDRNRGRDHREDVERRNNEEKKSVKPAEFSSKSADVQKVESKTTPTVKNEPPARPPRKPITDDLSFDLFRLQTYSNRNRRSGGFTPNIAKNKNEQKAPKPPSESETTTESKKEAPVVEKAEPAETEDKPMEAAENDKSETRIEPPDACAAESRSRRDRADRKRSRWGRTLSQEREFQQQRINELEMKFQNFENQHQAAENVNGCSSVDQPSDVSSLTAEASVTELDISETPVSDSMEVTQPDCESNQNISPDRNDNHVTEPDVNAAVDSVSEPQPDSICDPAQIALTS